MLIHIHYWKNKLGILNCKSSSLINVPDESLYGFYCGIHQTVVGFPEEAKESRFTF